MNDDLCSNSWNFQEAATLFRDYLVVVYIVLNTESHEAMNNSDLDSRLSFMNRLFTFSASSAFVSEYHLTEHLTALLGMSSAA